MNGPIILMSVRVIVSKVLKFEKLYVRKKKVGCICGKAKQEQWKHTESKGSIDVRLSDNFCRVSGGDRLFSMLTAAIFSGSPVETYPLK